MAKNVGGTRRTGFGGNYLRPLGIFGVARRCFFGLTKRFFLGARQEGHAAFLFLVFVGRVSQPPRLSTAAVGRFVALCFICCVPFTVDRLVCFTSIANQILDPLLGETCFMAREVLGGSAPAFLRPASCC